MATEILAALIGAAVTMLTGLPSLVTWFREWRARDRQLYKLSYVKIVRLADRRVEPDAPHRATIQRLGSAIDVWDEFHYFRLNVFRRPRREIVCVDRSSGAVDLQILHPWQERLVFTDEGAAMIPGLVSQRITNPSTTYFTKSIYYNGLQHGNEDLAMKMEHDTDEARMIVDFSSVPGFEAFLAAPPTGTLRTTHGERTLGVAMPYPGIFSVEAKELKCDDVLRMNFTFRWSAVPAAQAVGSA